MKKNIYEITYWARNEKGERVEEQILNFFEEDFELIKKIPPKTKNLAYPLEKETIGQLGTIYFYAPQDKIESFKNKVKSIKEILRFIILKRKVLKVEPKTEETLVKTEEKDKLQVS